jgi:hypothetical protein
MESGLRAITVFGMARRRWCTVLFTIALAAAAPLTAAQAAPHAPAAVSSAQPTLMQHIRPVDATGHLLPGFSIAARHRGAKCQVGSDAIGSQGYRCFAGKFIYDPCWVGAHKSFVYCLEAPWSFDVVRLHVVKYDNSGLTKHGSRTPFGVELDNGQLCALVQGSTNLAAGKPIRYRCQHTKSVLIGKIDRSHRAWRILKARPTSGGHYARDGWVNIAIAWFGMPSRRG